MSAECSLSRYTNRQRTAIKIPITRKMNPAIAEGDKKELSPFMSHKLAVKNMKITSRDASFVLATASVSSLFMRLGRY